MRWAIKPFPRPGANRFASPAAAPVCSSAYSANPTDPELQCRIAGRCDSGRWNHSRLRRSGVVAHARNTGRRLAVAGNLHTQLGPMPAGVPMGCPVGLAAPGAVPDGLRLRARPVLQPRLPERGLVSWRGPTRRTGAPLRPGRQSRTCPAHTWRRSPRRAHAPGLRREHHDVTLKNPALEEAAGCGDLKKSLIHGHPGTVDPSRGGCQTAAAA